MKNQSRNKRQVSEDETPRLEDTTRATREETSDRCVVGCNEGEGSKPRRGSSSLEITRNDTRTVHFTNKHKIGTWNVRSMYGGKLELVKSEMERTQLEVLGVSELRWTGCGHFQSDKFTVFYSGQETTRGKCVALILEENMSRCVLGLYNP